MKSSLFRPGIGHWITLLFQLLTWQDYPETIALFSPASCCSTHFIPPEERFPIVPTDILFLSRQQVIVELKIFQTGKIFHQDPATLLYCSKQLHTIMTVGGCYIINCCLQLRDWLPLQQTLLSQPDTTQLTSNKGFVQNIFRISTKYFNGFNNCPLHFPQIHVNCFQYTI